LLPLVNEVDTTTTLTTGQTVAHVFATDKEGQVLGIASRDARTREYNKNVRSKFAGEGREGDKTKHYTRTEDIAVNAGFLILTCAGCGATKQRSGTKHNEFHQVSGQDLCNNCARKVGRQASGIEARTPRTPGRPKQIPVPDDGNFHCTSQLIRL